MSKTKLSGLQLGLLFFGFLYGSTSILNPAAAAMNDAWIAFIIGWIWGFLLIGVYITIYMLNPSMTLIGILKSNFGKFLGTVISFFYIWYFIHLAAVVLRNFGEFATLVILPNTPLPFIVGCYALVCAYSLKKGIEVTARTGELLVPLVTLATLFVNFGMVKLFNISNLRPILSNGIKPVLTAGFALLSFPFGETIAFLMVFHLLNKKSNIKKSVYFSVFLGGLMLLSIVFTDILALGAQLTKRATFPAELASKVISAINVYPLVMVDLLIGGAVKTTVSLYAAATGISETLRISNYKALVLPISAFTVVLSIWAYDNVMEMFAFAKDVWPYYSIPFQIIIPLLLLVISIIKKAAKKKKTA